MKPPQALLFDLDDTLLDSSGHQDRILQTCEVIAAHATGLEARALFEANSKTWPEYWREVEEKWTLGSLDSTSLGLEAWRRTLRVCGCNDISLAQLAAQTLSRLGRDARRLFDDVAVLLSATKRARVPLGIVTNAASDYQRENLHVLDLERWFDVVVISGEVGIAKPDASAFGLAIDKLGVERESVWHVGDSLTTDVAGAKAAGIIAVWLNRRGLVRKDNDPEPHLEIRSLSSLAPYFSE
jgi:FMN phosphatase YigB (HAD superfamily)